MSLVIDDPNAEALARELARREGVSPAEAVARALQARLDPASIPAPIAPAARRAALARLAALQADIARRFPAERDPLAWEEVKRWAEDDEDA